MSHKLRHDPTIITHSKSDPFPYLRVGPNDNLKLYAVNQKFEQNEKDHIDLMDILSDRYDIWSKHLTSRIFFHILYYN